MAPRWGSGPVALLYIPPVLVAAAICGLWPALAAAMVSTLAYNFYFTEPYRTFLIHSPADVVTVVVLFLVAARLAMLGAAVGGADRGRYRQEEDRLGSAARQHRETDAVPAAEVPALRHQLRHAGRWRPAGHRRWPGVHRLYAR